MLLCYKEIEIFDDMEIGMGFVWSRLYDTLHRKFVSIQDSDAHIAVGVSFPDYGAGTFRLGARLRLFSPDERILQKLELNEILDILGDYIDMSETKEVPTEHSYALFSRKQFKKSNPLRLARRYAKRHGVSLQEAIGRYATLDSEKVIRENNLPFINMNSASTNRRYKLFVKKEESDIRRDGVFNTFGLGGDATVPIF